MNRRVCALIVTYNPDPGLLRRVLESLAPQVDHLLVVDNASAESPGPVLDGLQEPGATLLGMDTNLGLAGAQNRGMQWLQDQDYDCALLLDQDSLPEHGMVDALRQALQDQQAAGEAVAAVGPVYLDPRTGGGRHFVRFPGLGVEREGCSGNRACIPADFLIASGSLLPVEAFRRIGPFEEALFIDNVDLEWCFRARSLGYGLYGVCAARMKHLLGDDALRVWLGRWWQVYRHGPLRQYYMARNRIALYRRPYSPRGWVLQDLLRFGIKLFWFGLVFAPRRENLRMIWRGTLDGWRGRSGRYEDRP